MIRAFVGVRIDPEMVHRISEVLSRLKGSVRGIRWVSEENFHFTLKFLGSIQEEKIEAIDGALASALKPVSSFSVHGRGIGVFPDIRKPRVLWVGLQGGPLGTLASEVEKSLESLGFPREKRVFSPHLTVGRWRHFDGRSDPLRTEIERWKDYEFGDTRIKEVVFFQSMLKPQGAVYLPLSVVPLGNQGPLQ